MFPTFLIFVLVVSVVNAASQNFIINGIQADAAPSFALIIHSEIVSGGHIITNRHILTAGHVVHDSNFWIVGIGGTEVGSLNLRMVSGGILHPGYKSNPRENDIGILILFQTIVFNEFIQPATLPDPGITLPLTNEQGQVLGFGWTSESNNFNNVLKATFQRVLNPVLCPVHFTINPASQFCAADLIGLTNICFGDLGGGFLTFKRDVSILVGIASMTVDLCSTSYPAVYTRVSHYRSWIEEIAEV